MADERTINETKAKEFVQEFLGLPDKSETLIRTFRSEERNVDGSVRYEKYYIHNKILGGMEYVIVRDESAIMYNQFTGAWDIEEEKDFLLFDRTGERTNVPAEAVKEVYDDGEKGTESDVSRPDSEDGNSEEVDTPADGDAPNEETLREDIISSKQARYIARDYPVEMIKALAIKEGIADTDINEEELIKVIRTKLREADTE